MFYVLQSTVHRYIVNSCFDYNYSKWNNFPLSPPELTYLQVPENIKGILSIRQKHIILVSQLAAPDREEIYAISRTANYTLPLYLTMLLLELIKKEKAQMVI